VLGLAGPSGSGKTTLLELLAGLRRPEQGRIVLADFVLLDSAQGIAVPTHRRRVGYVPQDGALFPHMTVQANVLYGAASMPVAGADEPPQAGMALAAVAEALDIAALLPRAVTDLSGGERQRVALARALMARPRLLLLDEPLSGVDRARKLAILPYLRTLRDRWNVPMVYVSHDADELAMLADEVHTLREGRLTNPVR
jgi:molybdate transport system ATP-binding protein